jgi:hypothetical protein
MVINLLERSHSNDHQISRTLVSERQWQNLRRLPRRSQTPSHVSRFHARPVTGLDCGCFSPGTMFTQLHLGREQDAESLSVGRRD